MRLLKNTNFLYLISAAFFSSIGDTFRVMAITFWVLEGSDYSPVVRSVLLLVGVIPPLVLGPIAGVFADRWNRRYTMIASDLIRAGLSCGLLLAFLSHSLPLTMVCVAISSIVGLFFEPARFALVPRVVGNPDDLTRANSIITSGLRGLEIITPPLAGLIYFSLGGAWLFGLDALSFVMSAAAILLVRVELPKRQQDEDDDSPASLRAFLSDAKAGLVYLRQHPPAWYFLVTTMGLTITSTINQVALIFLITTSLGRPATDLGWVFSVNGVAQLFMAVAIAVFAKRIKAAPLLVGSLGVMVLTQFGMGTAPNMIILSLWVLVSAIANAPYGIAYDTVMQQNIAEEYMGRVYGLWDALESGVRVLLLGSAGLMIAAVGPRPVMIGAGVIALISVLIGYFGLLPSVRRSEPNALVYDDAAGEQA